MQRDQVVQQAAIDLESAGGAFRLDRQRKRDGSPAKPFGSEIFRRQLDAVKSIRRFEPYVE